MKPQRGLGRNNSDTVTERDVVMAALNPLPPRQSTRISKRPTPARVVDDQDANTSDEEWQQ